MNSICELPAEILANILSLLSIIDLKSCKRLNRHVEHVINNSVLLRYAIAVDLAGVEDNPRSNLSIPEKLIMLTQRELSWMKFEPDLAQSISVDSHLTSSRCDLTNGDHLLGALGLPCMHHLQLRTAPSPALAWSRPGFDDKVIHMALAVHESDLVVIVTSTPNVDTDAIGMVDVELHFRSFETGRVHPLASHPTILAENSGPEPSLSIEIMGDLVALAISYVDGGSWPPDEFAVWNWKTGASLVWAVAAYGAHPSVVFLTSDILLVPNATAATLEFWRIPSSSDDGSAVSSNPIHTIGLPSLTTGTQVSGIGCRGERLCASLNSGRPFDTSSQQAIIVFHIHIRSDFMDWPSILTLVVHRHSLVELINKHLPQNSTEPLPWVDWGPSLTRWFVNDESMSADWVTTSAGQRFVSMPYGGAPSPITVYDFNPHNVAKMKDYLEHHPNPNMSYNEREDELEGVAHIFEDPVRSALPYCCTRSEGLHTYSGIFMDDERLLGFKTGYYDDVRAIDVMHFGQPRAALDRLRACGITEGVGAKPQAFCD